MTSGSQQVGEIPCTRLTGFRGKGTLQAYGTRNRIAGVPAGDSGVNLALWATLLHPVLLASIQIECLGKSLSLPLVTTIESELCIPRTRSGSGWFRLGPEPLTVLPQDQNSLLGKGWGRLRIAELAMVLLQLFVLSTFFCHNGARGCF